LYRNLLRTAKPFTGTGTPSTSESHNKAVVLSCLLQRTGIDDHIKDWDGFIQQVPQDEFSTEDRARDLTYSYGERLQDGGTAPSTATLSSSNRRTYQRLFRRLLREVVTGTEGYAKMVFPSQVDSTKLRRVIQREFRCGENAISKSFDDATRRHCAFVTLKELNKKLSYFENLSRNSPEPIPQQAAWQVSALPFHPPSSYLRPGVFLVSHPYMSDSYFSKTVICILEHTPLDFVHEDSGDEDNQAVSSGEKTTDRIPIRKGRQTKIPGQTYGIIVNRVSVHHETGQNRTLREAFQENMLPEKMANFFGDTVVREGGPVHVALQMIHSLSSSPEGEEVAASVGGTIIPVVPDLEENPIVYNDRKTYFQGNMFKAMTEVENGRLDRDDVSFFVGASTWAPGQLASEIAQGYWIPCRGPPHMALHGICEHEPTVSGRRPLADLWLSMMSACGEDEAKLANLFYHEQDDQWDGNGLPCDSFEDDDDLLY
jgi:putative AlgH/UPF0301 family transcriptional regulator